MLGVRPTSSVSDVLFASGDQVTLDTVKPHLMSHSTGVQLLASTLNYDHILHLNDRRLEQLIATLKSGYAYTVVDVPHILEPRFEVALQLFDKIVLVISPDMPSLQSAAMAFQGLNRLGIAEQKITLIVNCIFPGAALPVEMIQKTAKRPVLATIPFEAEMLKAVNSGKPLLLASPQSPASAAIAKLAGSLLS
jgi:pilus assembly protein CpaE